MKGKEVRSFVREFASKFSSSKGIIDSAKQYEEVTVDEGTVFFVDGRPLILQTKHGLIPSLKFDDVVNSLPKVVVDMGAVPHVANGAQVMRPGVREFRGEFSKGDLVAIVDEKFGKAIALGVADADAATIKSMNKGKVIANVHYVGDEFWKAFGT